MEEFRKGLESDFAMGEACGPPSCSADVPQTDSADSEDQSEAVDETEARNQAETQILMQDAISLCRRIQWRVDLSRMYHHRRRFPAPR